jgi:hypothetical protein
LIVEQGPHASEKKKRRGPFPISFTALLSPSAFLAGPGLERSIKELPSPVRLCSDLPLCHRRLSFPALKDLFRVLCQVDMLIHSLNPSHRDEVVLAAGSGIALGHLDRIALYVIDFADVFAARGNNFHVFADFRCIRHD